MSGRTTPLAENLSYTRRSPKPEHLRVRKHAVSCGLASYSCSNCPAIAREVVRRGTRPILPDLHRGLQHDPSKRQPVHWTRTMDEDRVFVGTGGVALVLGKAILRVDRVEFYQQSIPVDLGEHRGRGHVEAARIALDHR